MNLYEAKKILNGRGCRLLRESTVYSFASPELYIQVEVDGQLYNAYGVTATGELTAGCGAHGDPDEFEIDPMSVMPEVEYWTDNDGNEVEETDELIEALCERLAEPDFVTDWTDPDMEEYHLGESVSRKGRALNESAATFHKGVLNLRVGDRTYTASDVWAHGDISYDTNGIGAPLYTLEDVYDMEVADGWYDEDGNEVEETEDMRNVLSDYIDNADIDEWDFD